MNGSKKILSGLIGASIIFSSCYGEKYKYDVVEVEEAHKDTPTRSATDTPSHSTTDESAKQTDVSSPQKHRSNSTSDILQRFKNIISKKSEAKKTTDEDKQKEKKFQKNGKAFNAWKTNITDKEKYIKYLEELEKNVTESEKEFLEKEKLIEKESKESTTTEESAAKPKDQRFFEEKRIKELNPLAIKYANYVIEKILADIYKNLTDFTNEKKEAVVNELKSEREQRNTTKKARTLESLKESIPMLSKSEFGGIELLDDSDLEFIKTIKVQENMPLSELFKKRSQELENSKRIKATEKLLEGQTCISTELSEIRDVILSREKEIAEHAGRSTYDKLLPLHNLHAYKIDIINDELENALKESGRNNVYARIGMLSMLENEALKAEGVGDGAVEKKKAKAKTKRAAKTAPEESGK